MDAWQYDTADDLDMTLAERLRGFPRQPDMLVYGLRTLTAAVIRTWLAIYHRMQIVGRENLPTDGSFIIVANHSSHLDALCVLAALPMHKIHRSFPAAALIVNALPFGRQVNVRQSLALCSTLLANPGNVLIIFPEGTRSATGAMAEFKPGIGALAAGTAYPVVPCHLYNCHSAWPKGSWLPRPRKLRVTVGKPLLFSHASPGKESAIQIARELHDAVQSLSPSPVTE